MIRAGSNEPGRRGDDAEAARWRCAFVNNMPDGAFSATERQFLDLLDAGSGEEVIEVRRYTMDGVPRGERVAARIAAEYLPLHRLRDEPPDLLIVTGSEPLAHDIADEPYWSDLADLLTWASDGVASMLLSCLSAHAALAVFDDVARTALAAQCTGVFAQQAEPGHPLVAGLGVPLVLPHSRMNTVPTAAVSAAGYRVALQSELTGWSVVSKRVGRCDVVLVQGHPEYDPSSLLREYQRDVGRYVRHERDGEPRLPVDCLSGDDWDQLRRLHDRIIAGERDPELLATFPFEDAGARAGWPWRDTAVTLYSNWLADVGARAVRTEHGRHGR